MQLYNKIKFYIQRRSEVKRLLLFRRMIAILLTVSFILPYISNVTVFASENMTDANIPVQISDEEITEAGITKAVTESPTEGITEDFTEAIQKDETEMATKISVQTTVEATEETSAQTAGGAAVEACSETVTEDDAATEAETSLQTSAEDETQTSTQTRAENKTELATETSAQTMPEQKMILSEETISDMISFEEKTILYNADNKDAEPLGCIMAARAWANGHYLWYVNTGNLSRHYIFCLDKGKVMRSGVFKPSMLSGTFGTGQNTFRIAAALDYFKSKGGFGSESGYEDTQRAIWNEGTTNEASALITYSNYLWKLTEENPERAAGSDSFSSNITPVKASKIATKSERGKISVTTKKVKIKNSDDSYSINHTLSLSGSAWKYFAKGGSGSWNTSTPGSHGNISVFGCFLADGSKLDNSLAKASIGNDGSLTVHINQEDSSGNKIATNNKNAVMIVMQVVQDYSGASSIQYLSSGTDTQRLAYDAGFSSPAYFAVKFYADEKPFDQPASITINKVDEFGNNVEGAEFLVTGYNENGECLTDFPVTFTTYDNNLVLTEEGNYNIVESKAPYGMKSIGSITNIRATKITENNITKLHIEPLYIANNVTAVSSDGGYSYTYTVPNTNISGSAYLKKAGNVFVTFKNGEFVYKKRDLKNVTFELHAAEDIYAGNILIFSNDQLITQEVLNASVWNTVGKHNASISNKSDSEGMIFYNNLPCGNYYVTESDNPYSGYGVYGTRLEFVIKPGTKTPINDGIYYNNPVSANCLVEKADVENEDKKLAGAEFTLYAHINNVNFDGYNLFHMEDTVPAVISRKNGIEEKIENTWIPLDTVTSDKNGQAMFDVKMPYGRYMVVETHAPEGYALSEESYEFTHTYDSDETYASGVLFTHTFKDSKQSNCIIIHKYGDVLSGAATVETEYGPYKKLQYETLSVNGVTFEIYDAADNLIETLITDESGTAVSSDLPSGNYTIKEVLNGGSLKLDSNTKTVEFKENETTSAQIKTVEFMNDSLSTALYIYKKAEIARLNKQPENISETDELYSYTLQPVSDVVFAVFTKEDIKNYNGTTIIKANSCMGYCVTDKDGIAAFEEKLCNGNYYYREIKAVDDTYKKDTNDYPFDIILDGEDIERALNKETPVVNEKQKGSIKVIKTDGTDTIFLKGVKFLLYDADKTVIGTFLTDANGEISIRNLPVGTYHLQETETLESYQLDNTIYEVNLTASNHNKVLKIKNKTEKKEKEEEITIDSHNEITREKSKKVTTTKSEKTAKKKTVHTGDALSRIVMMLFLAALFAMIPIYIIKKGDRKMLQLKNKFRILFIMFFLGSGIILLRQNVQAASGMGKATMINDTIYVTYDDCTYQYVDTPGVYGNNSYFVLISCNKDNKTYTVPDNISFVFTGNDTSGTEEDILISQTIPVKNIQLEHSFYGTLVIPESSNIEAIDLKNLYYIPDSGMDIMVYKKDVFLNSQYAPHGIENCFTVYYNSSVARTLISYMTQIYGENFDMQKLRFFKGKINYVLNGGTNNPSNPAEYVIFDRTELKEPTRKNYKFAGWYTTDIFDGNTQLGMISNEQEGDITVYARWEYAAKVTRDGINYQINEDRSVSVLSGSYQGTVEIANVISYNGYSYPVTTISRDAFSDSDITAVTIPENIAVIEAGAFRGCSNLSDLYIDSMTLSLGNHFSKSVNLHTYGDSKACLDYQEGDYTGNLTIYSSQIQYVLNGGTNGDNPDIYTWKSQLILDEPQKENCKFLGWYTDAAFQTSSSIKSIYADTYHDIVLYAKWITLISEAPEEEEVVAPTTEEVPSTSAEPDYIEISPVESNPLESVPAETITAAPQATTELSETTLEKPTIDSLSVKNVKTKKIKIVIKASNATGYQIKYSSTKQFSKNITVSINTKKSSCTIKNLKKGKTYYIKIRGYHIDANGNKVYSSWSSVKKVKIKK